MEILREEEEAAQRSHRLVRSDCSAPVQTLLTGDGRDLCRLFRCSKRFLEQNSRLSHYTAAQPNRSPGAREGQHFPGSRDHMWTRGLVRCRSTSLSSRQRPHNRPSQLTVLPLWETRYDVFESCSHYEQSAARRPI